MLYICSKFAKSFNIKRIKDSQLYKLLSSDNIKNITYSPDFDRPQVYFTRLGSQYKIHKSIYSTEYVDVTLNHQSIYPTFENTINMNPEKLLTIENINRIFIGQSEHSKNQYNEQVIKQKELDLSLDKFRDYAEISENYNYYHNTIYITTSYDNLSELISDAEIFTSIHTEYKSSVRISRSDLYINNITKNVELSSESTIVCVLSQNVDYQLESFKTYLDVY